MSREGSQRRYVFFWMAKDSKVETSMTVLWPLEPCLKFSVSFICLEDLLFRTLEKIVCWGLMARPSGRLTQLGRATAYGCIGYVLRTTRECHLQNYDMRGATWSCAVQRSCTRASHFSTCHCQTCAGKQCHNLMLSEPLLLA